jgi:hypothetical protein
MRDIKRKAQGNDMGLSVFGRSSADLPRSTGGTQEALQPLAASSFASEKEEALRRQTAETMWTAGERLLAVIAGSRAAKGVLTPAAVDLDLFQPRADILFRINSALQRDFDVLTKSLGTIEGVESFRAQLLRSGAKPELHRTGAPDVSLAPMRVPLVGLMSVVVGIRQRPATAFAEELRGHVSAGDVLSPQGSCDVAVALDGPATEGLPGLLFRLDLDYGHPTTPIFISPVFPAIVSLNDEQLRHSERPCQVRNGDVIAVHRPAGKAPLLLQMQIVNGGHSAVRNVLSADAVNPPIRVVPPINSSDAPAEGSIEISVVEPDIEHRGLQFRDYAGRGRTMDFADL